MHFWNQIYLDKDHNTADKAKVIAEKIKEVNGISVIGYITEEKEGATIITKAGNKHKLVAQGWNAFSK